MLQKIANKIMARHFKVGDTVECVYEDIVTNTKKGFWYVITKINETEDERWPSLEFYGQHIESPNLEDFKKVENLDRVLS